jgi:ATPase subunit of ABC transporter with duplicated ATPase domains
MSFWRPFILVEDTSAEIIRGVKIALIGANWMNKEKSPLLRIIARLQ